ncbi:MAG TPA: hypothetical protein VE775_01300, partial [Pyrinomonadaceae bacterium]|nr:hypothetical protein [Pyrinomonadaceae bacterium]
MVKQIPRRQRLIAAFVVLLSLVCAWPLGARAAWRGAGNVVAFTRHVNGVVLTLSSGARAFVTLQDLDVVRVRLAPRGVFERDQSYAIEVRDRKRVDATV